MLHIAAVVHTRGFDCTIAYSKYERSEHICEPLLDLCDDNDGVPYIVLLYHVIKC